MPSASLLGLPLELPFPPVIPCMGARALETSLLKLEASVRSLELKLAHDAYQYCDRRQADEGRVASHWLKDRVGGCGVGLRRCCDGANSKRSDAFEPS